MRLKNLDLIAPVIIAVMNVVWALLPSRVPLVGIVLALPLVFLVPGYLLTKIFFNRKTLDVSHCLVFSLGLSLTVDILGGLVLNLLPPGLQQISWVALLGLLTLILSLLLIYLRRGEQVKETLPVRFHLTLRAAILLGLASTIAIFAVSYAAIGAAQQPYPGFTQLWMLPVTQTGKSCAVRLGVRSFESASVTYRVTVTINGSEATPPTSITLTPQQEWNEVVGIAPVTSDNVNVEARLYRTDKPGLVYRKVNVTFPNAPEGKKGNRRPCGTSQGTSGS